ncbi:thioredoxin-like protein [Eremomyces bilateralis CBS 781.70]|uniref:Thioredoxin-like protein n=1 Tax=Eremomyces bilateralis CBS 781.70 TaxID=1392243 RepID=A0A6G1GAY0_9PEZI|nr:thioredoxin-like protein [Eremomyces bilateralis CBS 781.70]KAF1815009.1 thioredoxin-like protein [Eremomyces bilateralis CBS 781.70]
MDFYADWCGPCKAIAPIYDQMAQTLAQPRVIGFTKINTDRQDRIAQAYGVTSMPTFIFIRHREEVARVQGANAKELQAAFDTMTANVPQPAVGVPSASTSKQEGSWKGSSIPRGFTDATEEVDIRGLDLLNADSEFGGARTLFDLSAPTSLNKGKSKDSSSQAGSSKDWVESDIDPQLMLYVPFNSTLKVHSIHITSLPPSSEGSDEIPMRPRTIRIFVNHAHNLGFEEGEDMTPTQAVELGDGDWDPETGTAKLELRYVKFQNVSSLVVFVVDGDGDGERTRIDRIRFIGDVGEKREMGKLEKIGDHE